MDLDAYAFSYVVNKIDFIFDPNSYMMYIDISLLLRFFFCLPIVFMMLYRHEQQVRTEQKDLISWVWCTLSVRDR